MRKKTTTYDYITGLEEKKERVNISFFKIKFPGNCFMRI
jgi:hypothetical protein